MGIVSGLQSGLSPGLKSGLNPGQDMDNPVFPSIAANLGEIMGEIPDNLWPVYDALPVPDTEGGKNFSQQSLTPLYGVATSGLWNGTDHVSMVAAEITGLTQRIALDSGEDLDPGTGSLAFLIVYKAPTSAGSNRSIISTRQAGDLQGWSLGILTTSGRVFAQTDPGASAGSTAIVTGSVHTDVWRYALVVIDRTADELRLHTELGSNTVSIAGEGTYSGTGELAIGLATYATGMPDMKIAYAAYWSGAKAENLGATQGTAFWQPQLDNPPS